ncbi:hypothetical protein [Ferrimonas sp. YFM]|uniref:hypothetical protein n=1 Tax=Ferrimonas sp. YFM TaxID=3028878 RepID=UPI0025733205|nr:hypothetical protein [Ferrimonas sp. YFM]
MGNLFSFLYSAMLVALYVLFPAGWLFWLWVAIKAGGFFMFFVALFPITAPFAALIGAWSLLFGMPTWAVDWFIT